MSRIELFKKTCRLIAEDRRANGRDHTHHDWLVERIDAYARDIMAVLTRIDEMIDKFYGR